jgi:tetratricopeptide (TPR) repeat protein
MAVALRVSMSAIALMLVPHRASGQEAAADAYRAVWLAEGQAACVARAPACEGMDGILDRAARRFAAAGRRTDAVRAWEALVDPRHHLERTPRALAALAELARAHEAIVSFPDAAYWWGRFAAEAPESADSHEALARAAVLHLRLGQTARAQDAARRLEQKRPDKAHLERWVTVVLAVAAQLENTGDAEGARKLLSAPVVAVDRAGDVDLSLRLHAALGGALEAAGRANEAAAEYGKVRSAAERRRTWWRIGAGQASMWSADARDAVARSYCFLADQRRAEAERIELTPYQGPGDDKTLRAYHSGVVVDWFGKAKEALEKAERAYQRVFGIDAPEPRRSVAAADSDGLLDPNAPRADWGDSYPDGQPPPHYAPSPRWAIRAAARVGAMWSCFHAQFDSIPVPPSWKRDDPPCAYCCGGDVDPVKTSAKGAFKTCLELSQEYLISDSDSQRCEAWLGQNYRVEYRAVDEFVGLPAWSSPRVAATPALLPAHQRRDCER